MAKIIVDTDIIIEFIRGNNSVGKYLLETVKFEKLTITYITQIEQIKGAKIN